MVGSALSVTRNGLRDCLIQRVTAVILGVYVLLVLAVLLLNQPLTFAAWQEAFSQGWLQFSTLLALLALFYHAWVGLWTIFTDYVKCAYIRTSLVVLVGVAGLAYLVWGVKILWGW